MTTTTPATPATEAAPTADATATDTDAECGCETCVAQRTCSRCALRMPEGVTRYGARPVGPMPTPWEDDTETLCADCYVAAWPASIHFVFHYGCPAWVRDTLATPEWVIRLRDGFPGVKGVVHFFARREAETPRWQLTWDYRAQGGSYVEPYSYRGWCGGGEIVVLVDETETRRSVEWVTLHELGHLACQQQSPFIDRAMALENRTEGRTTYEWKDDAGHEADSEERLVNRVATAWMQGREYARPWWRRRVERKLAGETLSHEDEE